MDVAPVGEGGASAVAGGPRGKLVYKGLEGLASTNHLLNAAIKYEPKAVLRDELYRVALDDKHRQTLQDTAERLPDLTTWLDDDYQESKSNNDNSSGTETWQQLKQRESNLLGALRMYNGCKVVHVPSYLKGLWKACQAMGGTGTVEWSIIDNNDKEAWAGALADVDCAVFAGGSGMFQTPNNCLLNNKNMQDAAQQLPIQLVRGQSIEMTMMGDSDSDSNSYDASGGGLCDNALLCGKYVSPLPEPNRILIGATHEFKTEPLDEDQVKQELRERSYDFSSSIWKNGRIDRITSGYRVQSNRGKHGRLPIIGQVDCPYHDRSWIFTGLSSRGLLYHGLFGDCLTDSILGLDKGKNRIIPTEDSDWWKS
ncbi:MAG: hypothetical protein SGILL_003621 [Bacillariaceae sp.]